MSKKLGKVFLFISIIMQIIFVKDAFADDILGRFDFKSEPIYYVKPKLTNINICNNKYMIIWKSIEECDGYKVYRKINNEDWKVVANIEGNNKCMYFDSEVNSEDVYTYTVSAYKKKNGVILVSKFDDVGLRYIEAPLITQLSKYYIKWNMCKNVDGYEIMYRDSVRDDWKKIDRVKKNTNFYSLASKYKKNRYFTVRAYYNSKNGKVYSDFEKRITLKNRDYIGKSILFEGDDITKGLLIKDYAEMTYPRRVSQLTGADIKVNAKNQDTAKDIIKRIVKKEHYFEGYDLIFISIGSNDYDTNVDIGKVTDNNKKTFCGQLNYIIKQIKKQNSKAKIVFVTPFYRNVYKKKTNVNCYVLNNEKGYSLGDYCDALEQVAKYKNVKVYDSRDEGIINVDNVLFRTVDLKHPTAIAHSKIGCSMVEFIAKNELL